MKKTFVTFSILVFFIVSVSATPKLFRQHRPRLKEGVKVVKTCKSCHNSMTGLKKKKGQNIKLIQKSATCSGRGCHGR